jgi:hypothetical protein
MVLQLKHDHVINEGRMNTNLDGLDFIGLTEETTLPRMTARSALWCERTH